MTGFSLDWLALREPADAAARAKEAEDELRRHLGEAAGLSVVDLGCGSGSNLRRLGPLLPTPQEWLMVDDAQELLGEAHRSAQAIHDLVGKTQPRDLADDLSFLEAAKPDLLTASALMDLVSAGWFDRLLQAVEATKPVLFFVLNYDGNLSYAPALPDDDLVTRAFNRHQRGEKGFGPALGPDAVERMTEALSKSGYEVTTWPSDWRLGAQQRQLQSLLLHGHAEAALEVPGTDPRRVEDWLAERLALLDQGNSDIAVGHRDLLAIPRHQAITA